MKTIIGFLLVLAIFGTTNSVSRVKRFFRTHADTVLNPGRKSFEAESNIVMPNLTWDDSLETIAREMSDNCSKWKHGADYRIAPSANHRNAVAVADAFYWLQALSADYEDVQNVTSAQRALLKKMGHYIDENADHWIMYYMEQYNDKQTRVACVDTICTGHFLPEVKTALNLLAPSYKTNGVCVYGPTNKFNPQVRKAKYAIEKRRGGGDIDYININKALALAEVLASYMPGGAQSESKIFPGQPPMPTPAEKSAPAPSPSPSPASTLATGWISVVVMVLGSFL